MARLLLVRGQRTGRSEATWEPAPALQALSGLLDAPIQLCMLPRSASCPSVWNDHTQPHRWPAATEHPHPTHRGRGAAADFLVAAIWPQHKVDCRVVHNAALPTRGGHLSQQRNHRAAPGALGALPGCRCRKRVRRQRAAIRRGRQWAGPCQGAGPGDRAACQAGTGGRGCAHAARAPASHAASQRGRRRRRAAQARRPGRAGRRAHRH